MTGTIFLIYIQKGFANTNMWGAILVTVSTASAALYKAIEYHITIVCYS
jgi:hypothetical protein